MAAELPELTVADVAAWRDWLLANHATSTGVRLTMAKKGTTEPTSLSYDQALEEALCQGWIDGQVGRRDAATFFQRWTPRRSRSAWSRRNVAIVERLIAEGRMLPAGLAEIERARADGRHAAAYAGPATIEVPADFAEALAQRPRATAMYAVLTSQNRFAILYRLQTARRADTRVRRIGEFVAMLERGATLHPQKRMLPDPAPPDLPRPPGRPGPPDLPDPPDR